MTTPLWRWLEEHGAHHDVVEWARGYGEDWARAIRECPRGDWLLGLAARTGADTKAVVRAASSCARLGLDYVPEDDARVGAAIEAAERWVDGQEEPEARRHARAAVEAAIEDAPDPAVAAAATAALAALTAIEAPDRAATAAAAVVQAAVLDVGECAIMSALRGMHRACADLVREHVELGPIPDDGP